MEHESTVAKTTKEAVPNLRTDIEKRVATIDEEFRGLSTLVSNMSTRWESPPPPASAAVPDNALLIRLLWLSLGLAAGLAVSDLLPRIWPPPTAIPPVVERLVTVEPLRDSASALPEKTPVAGPEKQSSGYRVGTPGFPTHQGL